MKRSSGEHTRPRRKRGRHGSTREETKRSRMNGRDVALHYFPTVPGRVQARVALKDPDGIVTRSWGGSAVRADGDVAEVRSKLKEAHGMLGVIGTHALRRR